MNKPYEIVETIRTEIKDLDYKPLNDEELAEMQSAVELAVSNNAIENSIRTAEEVAMDDMLIEERAPDDVRLFAKRRYIEEKVMNGKSLKGKLFAESAY